VDLFACQRLWRFGAIKILRNVQNLYSMNEHEAIERGLDPSDQPNAPAEPTSEAEVSEGARLRELERLLDEARNKQLYLLSDFENYKRNSSKERLELIQTAGREVVTAMLPVLDDFERAAQTAGLDEGIMLIYQKLVGILASKGLSSMEAKKGDAFDADRHEAVANLPASDPSAQGKLVDVVEQGYVLGDRIIRYAKVVVGT
jgi:molecular chaperone GrpE